MKRKIQIVGAGVSGLTTAIVLLENEFDVCIIAEKLAQQTVSAKAAAIWFPFKVEPKYKAKKWSREAYDKFKSLSEIQDTGVSMIEFLLLIKNESDAWWKSALPVDAIRKATREELPKELELGYMATVPLIETPIYLVYLQKRFDELGGVFIHKRIENFDQFQGQEQPVINCTGLAAKELVDDQLLYPIRGQIVKIAPQQDVQGFSEEYVTIGQENKLVYVIPRKDCIVLGGTADEGEYELNPDKSTTRDIVSGCQKISKDLDDLSIQEIVVGLRPGRSEVRLEYEKKRNVIHNYGHGGGGFTVSWGCAYAVKELLQTIS